MPDLIDKPLFLLGLGKGRGFSHSLLFIFILFLILFISSKGNLEISLSLLLGMVFHLVLDLPDIPLFYPFISYNFLILKDPIISWITEFFTDPVAILTEITGIGILIYILITHKLYHRSKFLEYLKGSPSILNQN